MKLYSDCKLAFFLAVKTLKKTSLSTSFLLIFILGLAFFNLLFVSSFLAGFSKGVLKSLIDTTTAHIIVMPQEYPTRKSVIFDQDIVRKQIETIPGVVATSRHYLLGGAVAFDKDANGSFKYVSAPIVGVTQGEEQFVTTIHKSMVAGEFPLSIAEDEVVLGANLAGGYDTVQTTDLGGVRVGEKVRIVYSNGVDKVYKVKGIFKVTLAFASNNAFISNKEAEKILSVSNAASEIMVRVDLTRHPLEYYVAKITALNPDLKVDTYKKRLSVIGKLIDAYDIIAAVVGFVSVSVSAITIFVIIYINALSKQKQIGILKAVGIKERIIELSYTLQSLFYVILGIIVGLLFLYVVAKPYLAVHPIEMPFGVAEIVITWKTILIDIVYMSCAALISGYIPARMIARKDILKVIWG
jgi:ABC-type lipoprotein release transport system permease subunit